MSKYHIPKKGDGYWIEPNPIAGREMKDKHRFVVITPKEINSLIDRRCCINSREYSHLTL